MKQIVAMDRLASDVRLGKPEMNDRVGQSISLAVLANALVKVARKDNSATALVALVKEKMVNAGKVNVVLGNTVLINVVLINVVLGNTTIAREFISLSRSNKRDPMYQVPTHMSPTNKVPWLVVRLKCMVQFNTDRINMVLHSTGQIDQAVHNSTDLSRRTH